jgi:hypothetical protein
LIKSSDKLQTTLEIGNCFGNLIKSDDSDKIIETALEIDKSFGQTYSNCFGN